MHPSMQQPAILILSISLHNAKNAIGAYPCIEDEKSVWLMFGAKIDHSWEVKRNHQI
jgi:hypothetical protein